MARQVYFTQIAFSFSQADKGIKTVQKQLKLFPYKTVAREVDACIHRPFPDPVAVLQTPDADGLAYLRPYQPHHEHGSASLAHSTKRSPLFGVRGRGVGLALVVDLLLLVPAPGDVCGGGGSVSGGGARNGGLRGGGGAGGCVLGRRVNPELSISWRPEGRAIWYE